jgi:hypothetical protein
MKHPFPLKEIALQSGLSLATVDRALHGRAHVSAQTARRVQAAIVELTRQEGQLAARGRRMFIDIVVEAPRRFSDELRRATAQVLPQFTPAVIRPRFHFAEDIGPGKTVAILSKIAKRGSQGIVLKAQNVAPIRAEIDRLLDLKIPVVTVFTDCPDCARLAYVGLNNANAGRTAAYLFAQRLQGRSGSVLTTTSRRQFQGEEARARAFAEEMARLCPQVSLREASGGAGLALGNGRANPPSRWLDWITCSVSIRWAGPMRLFCLRWPMKSSNRNSSSPMIWTAKTAVCCGGAGWHSSCIMICAQILAKRSSRSQPITSCAHRSQLRDRPMCKSSHPRIVRAIDLGTHATGLQAQFRQIAVPLFQ